MDDCNSNFVASLRYLISMKSKFSPKFTIVTPYPMMFSAEDLKYVELEIIDTLVDTETASFKHLPSMSDHTLSHPLTTLAEEEEPQWLKQTKQQLETLWKIEMNLDQDRGSSWTSAADPIFPRD